MTSRQENDTVGARILRGGKRADAFMGSYNFVSPGAAAGNAIQQFLMQRFVQQRQAQMDALAQQAQEEEAKQKAAELELRTGQERRQAAAQQAQMDDLANQREFGRATTIAENALPGDVADDATRALLEKQGYGGQVKKVPGVVVQGAQLNPDTDEVPLYDVTSKPDTFQMRGGSKYLAARQTAEEKAAEAEKTRTAAGERADADRELKLLIAKMSTSNSAETQGLRNDLLRIQTALAQDKLDATKRTREDVGKAVAGSRAEVRELAQSLIDDPALTSITGTVNALTPDVQYASRDAANRLKQLVGKLSLQARGQMKGQGQISDYEGRLLSNAVSAIDRAAGPDVVKKHLQEIVDAFSGDAPRTETDTGGSGGGGTGTSGGSSFRVVRKH